MKNFTGFLEDFGFKEKAADKVDVRNVNINIDVEAESKLILDSLGK